MSSCKGLHNEGSEFGATLESIPLQICRGNSKKRAIRGVTNSVASSVCLYLPYQSRGFYISPYQNQQTTAGNSPRPCFTWSFLFSYGLHPKSSLFLLGAIAFNLSNLDDSRGKVRYIAGQILCLCSPHTNFLSWCIGILHDLNELRIFPYSYLYCKYDRT